MGRWAQQRRRGGGGGAAVPPPEIVISDVVATDGNPGEVSVFFTQDIDAGIFTPGDWTFDGTQAGVIVQGVDPNVAVMDGAFSVTGGEAWSTTDPTITGPPTSGTITPF